MIAMWEALTCRLRGIGQWIPPLILRLIMGWVVGVRAVADETVRTKLWLVPFRDAIHFIVWLASFASNKIRWSGEEFTMREGRMTPLPRS